LTENIDKIDRILKN